ncbi:hypothetical protein LTS02_000696 [Friedmanniomyces endolithicus]|nr:hypothetical protein LTR94_001715 [Friedmanniomyces endolithicus]KAK0779938.1 hypothetical protein LTR38_014261 [Friedmanniomyces endolithicus]KAK0820785.1 hypothetical protein LTR75_001371 [Friedmanniomyces endolithicus]KAK0873524.1 hypothetical protein LTS02_000696 [Friedmanniomyces endolithicus]
MADSPPPDRSAAQDDDAIDPRLRETPTAQSEMPDGSVDVSAAAKPAATHVDHPGDQIPAPEPMSGAQDSVPASDDGLFVPEMTNHERQLQAQAKFAKVMKARISARNSTLANPSISETAAPTPDDASEITTTVAEPGSIPRKKDEAALAFARVKAAHERKKRAGTLDMESEIAYMKAHGAEDVRLRELEADEEYDRESSEEEGAAISEARSDHFTPLETPGAADDEVDVAERPAKRRYRKRANPDDDGPAPKKPRKNAAKTEGSKKKAGDSKKKARGAKPKDKKPPPMANLSSIMGTNVFEDAAATANLPQQPTSFGETVPGRRDKALAQLIASVPDSDQGVACADKQLLNKAIMDFTGQGSVKPSDDGDGSWLVSGMKTTLKHYQVLGTAFMRRREGSSTQPKGGILADEMGLGKTVMMLANIVNSTRSLKKTAKRRCTLIVASRALITQWEHEILKHTLTTREHKKHGIRVACHYAGNRFSGLDKVSEMEKFDVVLTTYSEVLSSYPSKKIPPELVTAKQKEIWWRETFEELKGDLHRVRWLRVVLDEAQAIKNHLSTTSKACRAISAVFHWAISGTPIQNTIKELYPYFLYIREPHTGSFKIFKENFVTPGDPTGMHRLQIYLNKFMVRRTHADTLFGARLLELPQPEQQTFWVEFNAVERQIPREQYNIIKQRFVEHINTISKEGGLEKKYHHIWTLILRLRQLCSHPFLIQGPISELLKREDFEKLGSITMDEDDNLEEGQNLLLQLRSMLARKIDAKNSESGVEGAVVSEGGAVPMDLVDGEGMEESTGGKHGEAYHFKRYLKNLASSGKWEVINERSTCSGCKQPPDDPVITSCWHIYCKSCITDLQHYAARRGQDAATCSECGEAYTSYGPCEGLDAFDNEGSTSESLTNVVQAKGKVKGKGKKKSKDDEMEDWISLKGDILPSSKTMATKAQILEWLEKDPDCKIIIFTQFLPMTRILEKICRTEDWSCCKYTGDMSHDSREKAIKDFAKSKQILISTLKSGGLGLNLICASRVINLDPWWNDSVEQQAFCRVFRIGQTKKTIFKKFVVRNTIDAAMMAMKERKQVEIDEAMSESRKRDLSVKELMKLFGPVDEDDEGHPFIFAEDDGSEEHLRVPNLDEEDEEQDMGDEA